MKWRKSKQDEPIDTHPTFAYFQVVNWLIQQNWPKVLIVSLSDWEELAARMAKSQDWVNAIDGYWLVIGRTKVFPNPRKIPPLQPELLDVSDKSLDSLLYEVKV